MSLLPTREDRARSEGFREASEAKQKIIDSLHKRNMELITAIKDADEWLGWGEGVGLTYYAGCGGMTEEKERSKKIIEEIVGE